MDVMKLEFSNKESTILNRYVLGIINISMLMFFIYNIFSKTYLPDSGTGIFLAIISGLAVIYVAVNIFVGGIDYETVKNMVNTVTMQDINLPSNIGKIKKDELIFRMVNAGKMFYISVITTFAAALFFKYTDLINEYHDKIYRFDSFFMMIMFSVLAQSMYIGSLQSTYLKELISKYTSNSYRSLILFAILNVINLIFLASMYVELKFTPTDG